MSSYVYGTVTAQRAAAPAAKSKTAAPPGMGTYLDTLTALVPAEALALYEGIVLPNTTKTVSGKTFISDSSLLVWSCAALLVLSGVLYLLGRKRQQFGPLDVLRLLIPPAALAAWMLVQAPGVWNIWWPGSDIAERVVIAAFAAVVLGIVAKALGNVADKASPAPAVAGPSPKAAQADGAPAAVRPDEEPAPGHPADEPAAGQPGGEPTAGHEADQPPADQPAADQPAADRPADEMQPADAGQGQ